jgi:hypothetical protein
MRSRAGSERLLFVGSTLYLALIAVTLMIASLVSAWAAPRAERWTMRAARLKAREIRRTRTREFWRRIGEWLSFAWLGARLRQLAVARTRPASGVHGVERQVIQSRGAARP